MNSRDTARSVEAHQVSDLVHRRPPPHSRPRNDVSPACGAAERCPAGCPKRVGEFRTPEDRSSKHRLVEINPILTIEGGEEVVVYKRKGPDWARVKTADGRAWWVEAKYLIEGDV